ncbi:hypothetical protein GGQ64_004756 [Rhizobium azooxidifex]|uniref:Uncharacterized protein n=1 Tax=Mycoplana azooxidifex TaxID=1636188 RepID=A0A7W6DI92_9HYPH|nr:hypothetical protein [Mycoplana azooxidifex]MBB3979514.1 hypothetical protein [Mycoplana azooxidifex]
MVDLHLFGRGIVGGDELDDGAAQERADLDVARNERTRDRRVFAADRDRDGDSRGARCPDARQRDRLELDAVAGRISESAGRFIKVDGAFEMKMRDCQTLRKIFPTVRAF